MIDPVCTRLVFDTAPVPVIKKPGNLDTSLGRWLQAARTSTSRKHTSFGSAFSQRDSKATTSSLPTAVADTSLPTTSAFADVPASASALEGHRSLHLARSRRFGVPLHATRNPDRSLLSRTLSTRAQPASVSYLNSLSNMGSRGLHWRRYGVPIRMDTIGPTTPISIGFICSLPEQDRQHHLPLIKFYPAISFHSCNMNETLARLSQP